MTDQLPADIAEAIEAFGIASEVMGGYFVSATDAIQAEDAAARARAALDAVILKHLRGGDKPLVSTAPAMLGALQCVVAAMDDMGFQQLTRSDSCPVLREALLDLIATAEGRANLRAVQ